MISQKCPKCLSNRVRRGYRPTPWWSKVLFRYNLLCDRCNWEFKGFAVPGTVSAKPTKNPKKKQKISLGENANNLISGNPLSNLQKESSENFVSLENLAGEGLKTGKKKTKGKKSGV
jgi:hypothetical protein